MASDGASRTFIGSVVCVDLVGYSTKSVAQQIAIKEMFNKLLAQALQRVRPEDRIILDTGDGAAVSFLGDPESGLAAGLALRDATAAHAQQLGATRGEGAVRIGINLGPMKLALDLNGYPRIVGDGINVAERIAAFAQPGEIVASRSFHDMVSRLSDANALVFTDGGTRTDKNGREHAVYVIGKSASAQRPAAPAPAPPPGATTGATRQGGGALAVFLRDRFKVGFAATLLVMVIAAEGLMLARDPSRERAQVASAPAASPPAPAPVEKSPAAPAPAAAAPERAKPEPAPLKPEPALQKSEPAAPKTEPARAESTPTKAAEAPVAKPGAPKTSEPPAAKGPEARASEPPKPARREEAPRSAAESRAASRKAEEAKSFAPPDPRTLPRAAPVEPPPEPPKAVAVAPVTTATPLSRAPVNFPPAAAARNIDSGRVKARLTIDAAGAVSKVQVLEAYPRRYFDDEATRSLKEWRFNAGADNRTYDVEIAFQR